MYRTTAGRRPGAIFAGAAASFTRQHDAAARAQLRRQSAHWKKKASQKAASKPPFRTSGALGSAVVIWPRRRGGSAGSRFVQSPAVFVMSSGPVFIKFGLLRGVDPAKYPVQHYLAANLRMRARCVELGGVRYPIDNVPMSAADWATHYGPRHAFFERAKARFDPHHLFAAPNREASR